MKCPLCENSTHKNFDPFCSSICKNRDLLKWLNEDYRIPTQETVSNDNQEKEDSFDS